MSMEKWQEVHPLLHIHEDVQGKVGPFPSLYVNDAIPYLKLKGVDPEAIKLIQELKAELEFAYDNWSRCALSPSNLIKDICASVGTLTPGADAFFQIIANYRATHNLTDA